jgi:hypothetical protein
MTKPNFIIVGVARCGTTSLYHYLKQHPDIAFPSQKEPKYFSGRKLIFPQNGPGDKTVDSKIIIDEASYYKLFEGLDAKCVGESSSDYLYYHHITAQAIKKELGDIPIVISIRNPIDRAFSAYSNLIRDSREILEFDKALDAEEKRISENYDWMWAYKKGGLYADGITEFQSTFNNVKVVLFDDLANNPSKVLGEIFDFLSVDDISENIDVSIRYSHSGKPVSKIAAILADRNNEVVYKIRTLIMKIIPRSFLERVATEMFKKDVLDTAIKKKLVTFFEKDIKQTAKLINKDLTHWLK